MHELSPQTRSAPLSESGEDAKRNKKTIKPTQAKLWADSDCSVVRVSPEHQFGALPDPGVTPVLPPLPLPLFLSLLFSPIMHRP